MNFKCSSLWCPVFVYNLLLCFSKCNTETCSSESSCSEVTNNKMYSKEMNEWTSYITNEIKLAETHYNACNSDNCSCHAIVIEKDLAPFQSGITKVMVENAINRGTKYQIIDGTLYRQKDCHFPARCAGVEHYLKILSSKLPNIELSINTRDWPQVNRQWGHKNIPVFSFSKTKDYDDIMYPAWSFWEGGPAISLYPTGIGRWDQHRVSITTAAGKVPWKKKKTQTFFRGSRTSEERDALILLSRSHPNLVDARYTKNQAWKSDADTLYAEPAKEVSFEDHCKYKYLFNYRGVAASFRFKHLFLCKSLVFHVGDDWLEFFYPSLKPWIHYVPINPKATQEEILHYLNYFKNNDDLAQTIANNGFQHIWDNLKDKDVKCYWKKLLNKYAKLLKYKVVKSHDVIEV